MRAWNAVYPNWYEIRVAVIRTSMRLTRSDAGSIRSPGTKSRMLGRNGTFTTSFPGSFSSLAPGSGKMRDPGNEVGTCTSPPWPVTVQLASPRDRTGIVQRAHLTSRNTCTGITLDKHFVKMFFYTKKAMRQKPIFYSAVKYFWLIAHCKWYIFIWRN